MRLKFVRKFLWLSLSHHLRLLLLYLNVFSLREVLCSRSLNFFVALELLLGNGRLRFLQVNLLVNIGSDRLFIVGLTLVEPGVLLHDAQEVSHFSQTPKEAAQDAWSALRVGEDANEHLFGLKDGSLEPRLDIFVLLLLSCQNHGLEGLGLAFLKRHGGARETRCRLNLGDWVEFG